MASKSYGWDVRNIAKLSPKIAKKTVFFRFFRFSQKLSIRFERKRVRKKKTLADSFTAYAALVYRLDRSTEATTGKNKPGPAQVGARSSF